MSFLLFISVFFRKKKEATLVLNGQLVLSTESLAARPRPRLDGSGRRRFSSGRLRLPRHWTSLKIPYPCLQHAGNICADGSQGPSGENLTKMITSVTNFKLETAISLWTERSAFGLAVKCSLLGILVRANLD